VIVTLGLFSAGIRWGCLAVVVGIGALCAGERRRRGSGWWDIYVAGAGVAILGALLAGAAATVGGILALIGGGLILFACAIGFPPGE